jgi:hypothetical protein
MPVWQVLSIASRGHDRLTKLLWCAGWTIPLAAFALIISIPFWQAVIADTELTMMQQIDYEDAALCQRFGFVAGSEKYADCMTALLDLRHSHERLVAEAALT